ncbi:MAG: DUF2690 domain-containing protein [Streptomyces sp.]|nr:DUF2690 domain-containing protein [Streptomyces sp.]
MRKKLSALGLGIAVCAAGLLAVPAAHAATVQPAVGCYGSSCDGKDPVQMGCDSGAYTAASVSTPQGFVELRYSAACAANWARISNSSAGTWFYAQDCGNGYNQQYYVPAGYTSGWTNMVDGTVTARAGDKGGLTNCV